MKRSLLICFLVAFFFSATAQKKQQQWRAKVDSVAVSGYYNIALDQRLVGAAHYNLNNLRISHQLDTLEVPVAYFIRPVSPVKEVSNFENYKIVKEFAKDSINRVLVSNAKQESLSRLCVIINNAEISLDATIRGGNKPNELYIVKQKDKVKSLSNISDEHASIILDFPSGNYKFYEIEFNNHELNPLKVVSVGKMSSESIYGQFEKIDLGDFNEHVIPNKKSVLTFPHIENAYAISKLQVNVATQSKYRRDAILGDSLRHDMVHFQLSVDTSNTFYFDAFKLDKTAYISIENGANTPLQVASVEAYALKRYICAYLEQGKQYEIVVDPAIARPVSYDIEFFKKEIGTDIPIIHTYEVAEIKEADGAGQQENRSIFEIPVMLWCIIIAVGLFLMLLISNMLSTMKKNKANEEAKEDKEA